MASLNKVMLIGNLGRDPEVSYTPAGMAIAKISLATTEHRTDKVTGEKKEKTEWHRVIFFGNQAETIGRYMSKGKQLYVEGRLQTSSYEKDGIKRYSTDVIANSFQFLGQKQDAGSFNQQPGPQGFVDNNVYGQQQQQFNQSPPLPPVQQQQNQQPKQQQAYQNQGFNQPQQQQLNGFPQQAAQTVQSPDDDIPF